MKSTVRTALAHALAAIGAPEGTQIEIETPRDPSHGDVSSPVAMGLAKAMRKAPRAIAEEIVRNLPPDAPFARAEVAGPGFINISLTPEFFFSRLARLVRGEVEHEDIGRGARIQVEFVSANPTGPLHLGHGRGAALGAALAHLLETSGYRVVREYYINDAGSQIRNLALSVHARYLELLGIDHPFPEEGYRGEYVADAARALRAAMGDGLAGKTFDEVGEEIASFSLDLMLEGIREDLASFGVTFETWQSERELYASGAVAHAIEFLRERGHVYDSGGALWFRAESFGDEKDRVVIKSDGSPTYFASDIAYHLKKVEAGYDEIVNIWGADHHGYIPRLEAVIEALGYDRSRLKVLLVQMVNLERGGVAVTMSKRAGTFVTLREVVEEVGSDLTKFIFLTRRPDSHLTFDLEAAKAASAENPVYYVQYAAARIASIFRKAREEGIDPGGIPGDLSLLTEPEEIALARKLLAYPMAFEAAARAREPHRLTFYLQELAGLFHPYYNRHRVLVEDRALTLARLALMQAVRTVLHDALRTLGVKAPERM
jgi:arginyl-tRNA synthetase